MIGTENCCVVCEKKQPDVFCEPAGHRTLQEHYTIDNHSRERQHYTIIELHIFTLGTNLFSGFEVVAYCCLW